MVKLQGDLHFSFGTSTKWSEQPQGDFLARIALQREPCVYGHMSKKSRVGRSALYFCLFFLIIGKTGNSCFRFRYFIFEISGKPSFVETVLWQVMQFFYLLCSQFRQKASGWINKTLLLIKQQKWLSEFCVKIYRIASKNWGQIIADKKG